MPMRKGSSAKVVSENIREMVRAGHSPSSAVAASLAMKRKYMAMGGEVDGYEEEDEDTPASLQLKGDYDPEEMGGSDELARALKDEVDMTRGDYAYADGGEVTDEPMTPAEMLESPREQETAMGPESMMLSEQAKMALMEKKKRRRLK